MLLLLLMPDARALQVLCEPAYVSEVAPGPGADGVPTDVALAFHLQGCDTAGQFEVTLALVGVDGELETVLVEELTGMPGQLLWVAPASPLLPNSEYRITTVSAWFAETSFRTGDGPSAALADGFDAELVSSMWDRRSHETRTEVLAFPVADPHRLSVVELVNPEDAADQLWAAFVGSQSEVSLVDTWQADRKPDEACVVVRQIDGAGRLVGDEALCAEPERVRGNCSTAPHAPAWLALVGLVGMRRRRGSP